MSPIKLIRIAAVAVAVIAAFVEIPYIALILIALGLAIGFMGVEEGRRMLFLVTAIALIGVAGALGPVPVVGGYLTDILTNVSAIINAGAVAVILTIIWERLAE